MSKYNDPNELAMYRYPKTMELAQEEKRKPTRLTALRHGLSTAAAAAAAAAAAPLLGFPSSSSFSSSSSSEPRPITVSNNNSSSSDAQQLASSDATATAARQDWLDVYETRAVGIYERHIASRASSRAGAKRLPGMSGGGGGSATPFLHLLPPAAHLPSNSPFFDLSAALDTTLGRSVGLSSHQNDHRSTGTPHYLSQTVAEQQHQAAVAAAHQNLAEQQQRHTEPLHYTDFHRPSLGNIEHHGMHSHSLHDAHGHQSNGQHSHSLSHLDKSRVLHGGEHSDQQSRKSSSSPPRPHDEHAQHLARKALSLRKASSRPLGAAPSSLDDDHHGPEQGAAESDVEWSHADHERAVGRERAIGRQPQAGGSADAAAPSESGAFPSPPPSPSRSNRSLKRFPFPSSSPGSVKSPDIPSEPLPSAALRELPFSPSSHHTVDSSSGLPSSPAAGQVRLPASVVSTAGLTLRLLPSVKSKMVLLLPFGTAIVLKAQCKGNANRVIVEVCVKVQAAGEAADPKPNAAEGKSPPGKKAGGGNAQSSSTTEVRVWGWASLSNIDQKLQLIALDAAPKLKATQSTCREVLPVRSLSEHLIPEMLLFEVVGEKGAFVRTGPHLQSAPVVRRVEATGEEQAAILPKGSLVVAYNISIEAGNEKLGKRLYVQQLPPSEFKYLYLPPYSYNINADPAALCKGWVSFFSEEGYPILSQLDIEGHGKKKKSPKKAAK